MNSEIKTHTGQGPGGHQEKSCCPGGVRVCDPPNMWACSPTQKLSKLCSLGIPMEGGYHIGMIDH